ncbi:MAG TPA: hypothetical protein VNV37_08775 [Solirubrobacteraceae bacterium]|jgi:hypothetical protein|nr:hypothetical protein [Solirubrobacteraceae bacterium]
MAKTVKTVQWSLLLLLAISAVAAAPASAASPEWWVEGSEIAKAETIAETVAIKQAPTLTVGSIATIVCSTIKVKNGIIRPGNSNSGTFAFESCSVVSQPNCEVPNFSSEPLVFPLEGSGAKLKLNFQPASGRTLAVLVINSSGGTCAVAKTYTITDGTSKGMACNYPGVETEKTEHELVFNSETGSEAFVGSTKVLFEGDFFAKLSSGHKWSVK